MSYNSAKGYRAEAAARNEIARLVSTVYRPRAGVHNDIGDLGGIPIVVSVKNQREYRFGSWLGELAAMVERTEFGTGVVWAKVAGRAHPDDWIVATTGRLWRPQLVAWLKKWEAEHG